MLGQVCISIVSESSGEPGVESKKVSFSSCTKGELDFRGAVWERAMHSDGVCCAEPSGRTPDIIRRRKDNSSVSVSLELSGVVYNYNRLSFCLEGVEHADGFTHTGE